VPIVQEPGWGLEMVWSFPPAFEPRIVQPLAIRCPNWAILATTTEHYRYISPDIAESNTCYRFVPAKETTIRSQRPRGLRRGSAGARLLVLWVRIPPEVWRSAFCESCVLSSRGLCVGMITRPEEFYRVRCVWMSVIVELRYRGGPGLVGSWQQN
jgi:hypothetical protein